MQTARQQQWAMRAPDPFPPPWASSWGEDTFGLWADLELRAREPHSTQRHGLVQRLRWIEAGSFMMGSPQSEDERWADEGPQHFVVLQHGFWLADTACTQALWQEVMGENPSQFNLENGGGLEHPVEMVNWLMVQDFLQKLAARLPAGQAALPSEQEWEYACRAGTTTPFWFGENIDTNQVNYDGERPYRDAKEGEYRAKTVPVTALPANAWGLYQMHGNVWEWCADVWRENYAQGSAVGLLPEAPVALDEDPLAGGQPQPRALRGGSWNDGARGARSACRSWVAPDGRGGDLGFRFVLRAGSQDKSGV
jgi:formylglycine-generating enzyme required for sulfatase activity